MLRPLIICCLLVNTAMLCCAQLVNAYRRDSLQPSKRDNYTFDLPSRLMHSGNHECILTIYQDLLNRIPTVRGSPHLNLLSAHAQMFNTVRCLNGIQIASENTRTFFIEQPWDEKFHHFEFRGKVAFSPNLTLFLLCPNISERMFIDQVRTPFNQKFSIDITAQIERLNIDDKAKCNITVISSNALSASHEKQKAADDFSLIILSKKENTRTPFREIAALSAAANGRHLHKSPSKRNGSNRCMRKQMKVDLWRVGFMNKYVIHPSTVDLGSCSGECHARNVIEKNASDRGVFLSLYQMTLGTKKPMTRCIPEKMAKLSLLHQDETGMYVSHVGDIIIDSCACQ